MNKTNLPTREECQELVKNSEVFYCSKKIVNNYEVELYNYRLSSFGDFVNNNAFELRGLCFVNNNGIWERNLLMNKFFNLNETQLNYYIFKNKENNEIVFDGPETHIDFNKFNSDSKKYNKEKYVKASWMLEDIKHKKIVRVQEKLDGSIISFVKFNDGSFVAKSKMSFESEHAQLAQKIFDTNPKIEGLVKRLNAEGLVGIFEICSPFLQIVLPYNETELKLIQVRNNETGVYLNNNEMNYYLKEFGLSEMSSKEFDVSEFTFDKLLKLQETEQNIEGWVVTLESGQILKIKTHWYFDAHAITTSNITRENLLLELVINDKLDDVLSVVQGEKKKYLEEISEKIQHFFNHKVVEYKKLRGLYYNKYNENRKEFALKYRNHELFNAVMKTLDTSFRDIEETAKKSVGEFILKKYNTLTEARNLLSELKNLD